MTSPMVSCSGDHVERERGAELEARVSEKITGLDCRVVFRILVGHSLERFVVER